MSIFELVTTSLLIISHYPAAPGAFNSLRRLLAQLKPAGADVIVICNGPFSDRDRTSLKRKDLCREVLTRPNIGMNIGAWKHGLQAYPGYKFYHLLQDESVILSSQFLQAYEAILSRKNVGLVGDSLNTKWNKSWENLKGSSLDYRICIEPGNYLDRSAAAIVNSKKSVNRVDYYRKKLTQWGCAEGRSAIHVRALNWSFSSKTLEKIDFPVGFSKHECIAAEIYVSRFLISQGLKIVQSSRQPFHYIGHSEWMNPLDPQRKITHT